MGGVGRGIDHMNFLYSDIQVLDVSHGYTVHTTNNPFKTRSQPVRSSFVSYLHLTPLYTTRRYLSRHSEWVPLVDDSI
jgi:hypothetical protein